MSVPQTYQGKPLTHSWPYTIDGKEIGAVARYEDEAGKVVIPMFKANGKGWTPGAPDEPRSLYGADSIISGKALFIVEGEKCAAALHSLGLSAVTSQGGCKAADKSNWEPVQAAKTIYLLPDNDAPGTAYMQAVAALVGGDNLQSVSLQGLPDKGDVVDFLQRVIDGWDGLSPIPRQQIETALNALRHAVKEHSKPYKSEQWDEPGVIVDSLLPVPVLPDALIPNPYRAWISDVAYRMQTPPDFAAVTAIVIAGSVIGTGCTIRPKQKDNWAVTPNLWGACIGRPTVVLKSPSMKDPMRMLGKLQSTAKKTHEAEMRHHEFDLKIQEAKAKAADQKIAAAAKGNKKEELDQLRNDYITDVEPESPTRRLYKTNETSIQSQTVLQAQNPRGILTFRDELMALLARWDQFEHFDERAYFLEGWNGDGDYTDFKIGRGLTEADNICIALLGSIQPDKLRRYLHQSMTGGNDGLMQRFQLAVYPDIPDDWDNVDEYPDSDARDKAFKALDSLDSLDFTHIAEKSEHDKFPYLHFALDAQQVFNEWLTELNRDKIPAEDNPLMAEHLGKYRSLMPSLALIFHLLDIADGTASGEVSKHAAILAAGWCEYLEAHARRMYGFVSSPDRESALILSSRIQKLPNPFTAKDVYRKQWHLLKDRQQVEAACNVLIDENWLRREMPAIKAAGGRPSLPNYHVNPAVLKQK